VGPSRLLTTAALIPIGLSSVMAQSPGIRDVSASPRMVIPLQTRLRYTTLVLLPDDEEIVEVVCGDKDFWVISAAQNMAHIKPAKEGASTNLNLVTASGAVYSFLLTEGKTTPPDLKVYVTADVGTTPAPTPKYVPATQLSALEAQLSQARAAAETAQRQSEEAIAAFKQKYPAVLQFAYGTPKYERPFFVRSIWHDGQFTYINADAREMPTVYEVHNGEPALINFQLQGHTYIVSKVLDQGYLVLGKDRFAFHRER